MQRLSISKGHSFILVFSITSRQTLEELRPIWAEICSIKGNTDDVPIMLVGNKSDEAASREVPTNEATDLARSWRCSYMETSAKTDHNVKELFQELLQLERKRTMTLNLDGKKSRAQKRREMLKDKCDIM